MKAFNRLSVVHLEVEYTVACWRKMLAKLPVIQRQGMQGWLDESGAWYIGLIVNHGRPRSGTCETGIQGGKVNPAR